MSFVCVICQKRMSCIDTRAKADNGGYVVRRYKCDCGLEMRSEEFVIGIVTADGRTNMPNPRQAYNTERQEFEMLVEGRWVNIPYRHLGISSLNRKRLNEGLTLCIKGSYVRKKGKHESDNVDVGGS
jgi:hypothetical protein